MAPGEAIVIAGEHRSPYVDYGNVRPPCRPLEQRLSAPEVRRGQMILAARKHIGVVVSAANAYKLLYPVVVRSDIFIADGPGDLPSVSLGGFEIQIGISEAHPAPYIRLAACSPHPDEIERPVRGTHVRLLLRIQEEVRGALAFTNSLTVLIGKNVRPEIAFIEPLARVEQQYPYPFAREVPCGHASGCARADHDDIVCPGPSDYLHVILRQLRAVLITPGRSSFKRWHIITARRFIPGSRKVSRFKWSSEAGLVNIEATLYTFRVKFLVSAVALLLFALPLRARAEGPAWSTKLDGRVKFYQMTEMGVFIAGT